MSLAAFVWHVVGSLFGSAEACGNVHAGFQSAPLFPLVLKTKKCTACGSRNSPILSAGFPEHFSCSHLLDPLSPVFTELGALFVKVSRGRRTQLVAGHN
jgi:hypothetical protein